MAQVCGACCGLLVFSAMIVCGLLAGNSVQAIVIRALVGLIGGFVLGSLLGWIGMCIVKENPDASGGDDEAKSPKEAGGSATAPAQPTERAA